MSTGGYKIINKEAIHFITFAVVEWVDVFTRKEYKDVLINGLKHCQKEKGLIIYAWCIMSNHVHLAVAAKNNDLSDILRDFKKFTAKQIVKVIEESKTESRKDWMLSVFKKEGALNSRNSPPSWAKPPTALAGVPRSLAIVVSIALAGVLRSQAIVASCDQQLKRRP
jgi:REP element-mobilizing transposase RayT